jgi:hypothetical protein
MIEIPDLFRFITELMVDDDEDDDEDDDDDDDELSEDDPLADLLGEGDY